MDIWEKYRAEREHYWENLSWWRRLIWVVKRGQIVQYIRVSNKYLGVKGED